MPTIAQLKRGIKPAGAKQTYIQQMNEYETISATADRNCFYAYQAAIIVAVRLTVKTTIAANDTNYWTMQIVNNTGPVNLCSSAPTTKATGGTAMTSDTAWSLGVDQNLTLAAVDVLQWTATKTSSANALVNPTCTVVYYWR